MTASNAAAALKIKPFESFSGDPRQACIDQIVSGSFKGNVATEHGCKWEDHIRDLFDAIMHTKTEEFGLIIHSQVHGENGLDWLAASPDGITAGNAPPCMVEIKAPYRRKIIPGEIPHHYYPQVQVQMEVCDIDLTYFVEWQPANLSHKGEEMINIVPITRDKEWFQKHKQTLYEFWKDLQHARRTYTPPPPPQCLIQDGLYATMEWQQVKAEMLFVEDDTREERQAPLFINDDDS